MVTGFLEGESPPGRLVEDHPGGAAGWIYLLRWDQVTRARLFKDVPPDPELRTGLYL